MTQTTKNPLFGGLFETQRQKGVRRLKEAQERFVGASGKKAAEGMARVMGEGKVGKRGGKWGVVVKVARGNKIAKWAGGQNRNPKESDIMFESSDFWVLKEKGGYGVYKFGITHSVRDSLYALTEDGLSIAIARAKYLGSRGKKSNPASSAASMYESFHGEPSEELLTFEETEHVHEHLAALGTLVELRIQPINGKKPLNICFDDAEDLELEKNPILWPWVGKNWVPYKTLTTEMRAQKVLGILGDKGITARVDRVRTRLLPTPKYKWEVLVHRDSVPDLVSKKGTQMSVANPLPFYETGKPVGSSQTFTFRPVPKGPSALGEVVMAFIRQHPTAAYWDMTPLRGGSAMITLFDKGKNLVAQQDTAYIKNPKGKKKGPIGQARELVGGITRTASKPLDQFISVAGEVENYLDGLMANPVRYARFPFSEDDFDSLVYTVKIQPTIKARMERTVKMQVGSPEELDFWKRVLAQAKKVTKDQAYETAMKGLNKINPFSSPDIQTSGPGCTYLCSNEEGTQLYFIGGDQSIDLAQLSITGHAANKESIVLGDLTHVTYHTRKIFDGKLEEFDYIHEFSEDSRKKHRNSPLPVLLYDRRNKKLTLSGGSYFIEKPFLGGTSPGLED